MFKKLDEKFGNNGIWQFVKFNLVSLSITAVQLLLANLLPLIFDNVQTTLPAFLQGIFNPDVLFEGESKYVVDGAVTWGYVLPFFLSNFIANVYGYFVNMKTTFKGKGTKRGLIGYFAVLTALILFTTWLQGYITAMLANTSLASASRTIAAFAAGVVQVAVLFPLEKYVLFKEN
jgi:putative flippase GtrA